ncbi:MAG TPA: precorrin-3B synthase [Xanthobacteraceae bacterium]|nr:precorrin-3B synthase [Xanthobacteraceae bacterium]
MNALTNAPRRRGACPGLSTPMQTGDGLLARLLTGATIGLDAAAALCAAARQHGNGIIEITARGSIQIRGLTGASAPAFADTVAALDIGAVDGVPILTDPLAGLARAAMIDAHELAGALRQRLAASTFADTLGPKVSVVIDGGSALHLDAVRSDLRLRANAELSGWHVALGGDAASAAPIGLVASADAVETAMRLTATLAQHGPQMRARDVVLRYGPGGFRSVIADLLIEAPDPVPRPPSCPVGTHPLRDGRGALGIGLAFGHTGADAIEGLIAAAARAGASGLRTAPGRALLVIGLATDASVALAAQAEALGFITRRDDPRRHIVACAGAPICAAAEIPARTLAPLISSAAASLFDGSLTLHLSGCPKGCAHPGACALTIVGNQNGCGLVVDGSARQHPGTTIAAAALPDALAAMAREITRGGRPGETSAATLARLGAAKVATIFGASPNV